MQTINRDAAYWAGKQQQLDEDGYTVIESLVPAEVCQASIDAICEFMNVDQNDRRTWYKDHPINTSGTVPMHHHPAFWQLRQEPGIYDAFRRFLGEDDLWVSMDRASFKPPCRYDLPQYGSDRNRMHWDYDFRNQPHKVYQGLVYLTDTKKEQGAFCCLPEIYRQMADKSFGFERLEKFSVNGLYLEDVHAFGDDQLTRVDAPAGSLVIFDSRLPHGNVPSHFVEPRFAQFVTMYKADSTEHVPAVLYQTREERIECYTKCVPPGWLRGWNGQKEVEPFVPAPLTALGRRLVGLD